MNKVRKLLKKPWIGLFIALLSVAALTAVGPAEKSLGPNVRVVYLHGVWVWTALFAYGSAAVVGFIGLITRRDSLHYLSRALGRTGLIFWITYLPLSLWAMQTNWNGLFLSEPRWRFAIVFAIGGLILQIGIVLLEKPFWASVVNIIFVASMIIALQNTESVMHPGSPIFDSDATRIQIYFLGLLLLTILAASMLTYGLQQLDLRRET